MSLAGNEPMTVHMKGVGRHRRGVFTTPGGGQPYLWVGDDEDDGKSCYIAIDDLRTLRKMKVVLDAVIERRERRNKR